MRKLLRNNAYFFVPYVVMLLVAAILLVVMRKGEFLLWVNGLHTPVWDQFFTITDYLGEGLFYAAVLLVFLIVRIKYGIALLAAFAQVGLWVLLLKGVVFTHMDRPKLFFQNVVELNFVEGIRLHEHYSFPSGHTTTAFTLFCLLALLIERKNISLLFLVFAVLGGLSRIYLCQHFLMDVFAGSLLGCAISIGTYSLLNRQKWYNENEVLNGPIWKLFNRK